MKKYLLAIWALTFLTTFHATFIWAGEFKPLSLPDQPQPNQWVYDEAGLLNSEAKDRINQFLQLFSDEKNISFYAVIISSLNGKKAESIATEVFEKWKIGNAKNGRGLLFLLSSEDETVRIETGYLLEPYLTDIFVGYIEREQMKPFYEKNQIAEGFEATLELIVQHLQDEIKKGNYQTNNESEKKLSHLSGGAGATTKNLDSTVNLDQVPQSEIASIFNAQPSPEQAFELYLEKDKRNIARADVSLFTEETRVFFKKWTITKAQSDNEYQAYVGKKYTLKQKGDRAVLLFSDKNHELSPFFFRKSIQGWQIDLVTATHVIRFNHRNQWRLVSDDHPYLFAFKKENK